MKNKLFKYEEALLKVDDLVTSTCGDIRPRVQSIVRNALAPDPPEMEEVEEDRWFNVYPGGLLSGACKTEGEAISCAADNLESRQMQVFKVLRAKPVPVERSVSVEVEIDHEGMVCKPEDGYELGRFPETFNKTGTITFTWQD